MASISQESYIACLAAQLLAVGGLAVAVRLVHHSEIASLLRDVADPAQARFSELAMLCCTEATVHTAIEDRCEPCDSAAVLEMVHKLAGGRAAGTRPIASPHAVCSCSHARSLLLLPGHRHADPTTDTAVVAFEPAGVWASAADGTAARPCT